MSTLDLSNAVNIGSPAEVDVLNELEKSLGFKLPADFRKLLLAANGAVFASGLLIYSVDEILERNETLQVGEYAPGYLAIGDDSGGRSILMALDCSGIFIVDQGSMDPDDMFKVASNLEEWAAGSFKI